MAFGSLLPGIGGWTSLAGSAVVIPSSAQNLCNPRTATTVRAAERTFSADAPSEPSDNACTKAVTWCLVMSRGPDTPWAARKFA